MACTARRRTAPGCVSLVRGRRAGSRPGLALGGGRAGPGLAALAAPSAARFTAYIFFSALALRAVTSGRWLTLAFAVGGVLLLQAPSARAAWPRLRPASSPRAR